MIRLFRLGQRVPWKSYYMLPVIVVPFLLLLFFLLGGGKSQAEAKPAAANGINRTLPDAHFSAKKEKTKLGLYESNKADSTKSEGKRLWELFSPDSATLNQMSFAHDHPFDSIHTENKDSNRTWVRFSSHSTNAEKERELEQKLQALERELNQPDIPTMPAKPERIINRIPSASEKKIASEATADPLPKPAAAFLPSNEVDPEMVQLNQMLDKLMAIQHPDSRVDSLSATPLTKKEKLSVQSASGGNTLSVIIPEHQTLVSGSTIGLQLTEPAIVAGQTFPTGHLVYGLVSLSNERLKIQIHSIRIGKTIVPVNLEGYDLDGVAGIYIPGSINREVSKESVNQGLGSLGLTSIDPSIGAQAASAGIQAAKTLLSRKVKLVRVNVPAGYQLLLKDAH